MDERREYVEDGMLVSEITGTYEMMHKNNEGEAVVTTLHKHSTKTRPLPEAIDPELFIRQAPPSIIRPTKRKPVLREQNLAIVVPDLQIPFHDTELLEIVQADILKQQPDEIVLVGDAVDFHSVSKYNQASPRKEWVDSLQLGVDSLHTILAQMRCNAPNARITLVGGNHEKRLEDYIRRNAGELLGIKRANVANELSVLTLPYLLRLGELEIEYVGAYPNGEHYLADNLKVVHGDAVVTNGSTAHKMLNRHDESVIFGHVHRIEVAMRTVQTRHGHRIQQAATFGTLALIDGSVPAGRYATDDYGQPSRYVPDWQNGYGYAEYSDTTHNLTPILL